MMHLRSDCLQEGTVNIKRIRSLEKEVSRDALVPQAPPPIDPTRDR